MRVATSAATNGNGRTISLRHRRIRSVLALLAAGVATDAMAVPTCTVASVATLSFGSVVALANTGDIGSNSGGSFWINCTSDVSTTPALYSATTRTLISGANNLPFALSAVTVGGTELPSAPPGTPLGITKNGSNQTVTLFGKISASDFKALPSGFYSRSIVLTVEY